MARNLSNVATIFARQGPRFIIDLWRAFFELAIARVRLGFWKDRWNRTLVQLKARSEPSPAVIGDQLAFVERIAFVMPRVASRVPWKSDCLVQALAAQRWLKTARINSTLSLGVRQQPENGFEAHAWLSVGTRLVTGGDIAGFDPLPVHGHAVSGSADTT